MVTIYYCYCKYCNYYSNSVTFQAIVLFCNLVTKATSYPQLCNSPPPGYDILESYKDRVCDSLPADCNTTAVRLQTMTGALDYMIQWALTGDMSQVDHRIYQIVLRFAHPVIY